MTPAGNGRDPGADEILRVLVIDDSEDDALLLLRGLEAEGYTVDARRVETARGMKEALEEGTWDLILADYNLPRFSAPAALEILHGTGLDLPFIIVSGSIGEERAVASLKAGAHDFVSKDNLSRLAPAVARELRDARVRTEQERTRRNLRETTARLRHLVSSTPAVIYATAPEFPYRATFVSENVAEVLGHPSEAFTASDTFWIEHVHSDDRPDLERRLAGQIRSGRGSNEYRFLCGDGRYRWIKEDFRLEEAENGDAVRIVGYLIDVTPRRVTEETLAQTEEAYRALFERSHDGIAITTLEGRILSANPAIVRLLGVTVAELRERSAIDFYQDPSDRDRFLAAVEGGPVRDFALRLRTDDGRSLDTLVSAVPLTWSEEQARGIITIVRDVTEGKRAQERLRQSEERFRQLAEHIGDVFWMTTPDKDEMLYVSPAYQRIWGRSAEELYRNPRTWMEAIHPDDRKRVRRALPDQLRGTYEEEYRVLRPDGGIRWIWDRAFPVEDDAGKVYRMVGVAEDVTERKEATAALTRMERYHRSLIENAADAIFVLESDGTIRSAGAAGGELVGVAPEDLSGRPALDFVHPDDLERIGDRLEAVSATPGTGARETYRVVRADGEVRNVESLARNLLDDPAVRAVVVNTRDVTDRVHLERQLYRSQKMEGLGRLAGGVAHDFNNLLTVIQGQTELLLDDLPRSSPLREEAEEIRRAAMRAGELTAQLLAFGKRQVLEPQVFDLNRSVLEMEKLLGRIIGEDVEMILELADDALPIRADPTGLEQVILNLAINAREAMPAGGRLTLRTRRAETQGPESGPDGSGRPFCLVEVRDTGLGIEPEHLERIFEPFFTTKEEGTGLGLATVYGIVEQSGGSVDVCSEMGVGTTFTVAFPRASHPGDAASSTPAGAEPPPSPDPALPGPRAGDQETSRSILVVDDDDALRPLIGRILRRRGHRVVVAGTVEEALRALDAAEERVDLVITDVTLPDGSGIELAEEGVRRIPGVPVLFISGYSEETLNGRDLPTLDTAFLAKPFTPDVLLRAVSKLLAGADRPARRAGG